MTVIITPVGTSLFVNGRKENSYIGDLFDAIEDEPESNWDGCTDYTTQLRNECVQFIEEKILRGEGESASAELQSNAVIIKDKLKNEDEIKVHLLASDTIASCLAAEILKDHINSLDEGVFGNNVTAIFNRDLQDTEIDVISNLQITNATNFSQDGIPNLFHRINQIWEPIGSENLSINITGGYGATLPYLTLFAQLKQVPLYYNFEKVPDKLVEIPQAPLAIDWGLIERYSNVLMQIDQGIKKKDWERLKKEKPNIIKDLDAFIWHNEDGALLTPIGEIFWNDYQRHFVVDLPLGSYYNYHRLEVRKDIDLAIQELYRRLDTFLRPSRFESGYEKIREEVHGKANNDDLNHGANVPNQNIFDGQDMFIFKSTDNAHIRFLYTFESEVYSMENNEEQTCSGEISRITIFDLHYDDFDHKTYIDDWKKEFGGGEPFTINFKTRKISFKKPTEEDPDNAIIIDFITRTFLIPQARLTYVLQDRRKKIR